MTSLPASTVPADSDVLCEHCGYTLNGLSPSGRCPECGEPVAESLAESGRTLTAWETDGRFWATTAAVVFRPTFFYRHLRTRVDAAAERAATRFARWNWLAAAASASAAAFVHYFLINDLGRALSPNLDGADAGMFVIWMILATAIGVLIAGATTNLAAWLTTWEAGWRGYRLPRSVVLRGLHYHAAHLPPVALAFLIVTGGYRLLVALDVLDFTSLVAYLLVLSAVVVVGLIYLFVTYWIGMKNMLYANQ